MSFPVAVGPDLTHNGGNDAFVAKLNSSGTSLIYCGYVGRSDSDSGYGVCFDVAGRACICGQTKSTQFSFPVAVGLDLTYDGGTYDVFVARINSAGSALDYCSYIGGSSTEYAHTITVDRAGNAYVTGQTSSTEADFPVIGGPDLSYNGGTYDVFVARIQYFDERNRRHVVGDFDGDGTDELVADFGSNGTWKWDGGV